MPWCFPQRHEVLQSDSARVQAMPEARMDKVAAYSDKINSGEYQVNAKELAGKILDMRF